MLEQEKNLSQSLQMPQDLTDLDKTLRTLLLLSATPLPSSFRPPQKTLTSFKQQLDNLLAASIKKNELRLQTLNERKPHAQRLSRSG